MFKFQSTFGACDTFTYEIIVKAAILRRSKEYLSQEISCFHSLGTHFTLSRTVRDAGYIPAVVNVLKIWYLFKTQINFEINMLVTVNVEGSISWFTKCKQLALQSDISLSGFHF